MGAGWVTNCVSAIRRRGGGIWPPSCRPIPSIWWWSKPAADTSEAWCWHCSKLAGGGPCQLAAGARLCQVDGVLAKTDRLDASMLRDFANVLAGHKDRAKFITPMRDEQSQALNALMIRRR